jgi:hypothetical protein
MTGIKCHPISFRSAMVIVQLADQTSRHTFVRSDTSRPTGVATKQSKKKASKNQSAGAKKPRTQQSRPGGPKIMSPTISRKRRVANECRQRTNAAPKIERPCNVYPDSTSETGDAQRVADHQISFPGGSR